MEEAVSGLRHVLRCSNEVAEQDAEVLCRMAEQVVQRFSSVVQAKAERNSKHRRQLARRQQQREFDRKQKQKCAIRSARFQQLDRLQQGEVPLLEVPSQSGSKREHSATSEEGNDAEDDRNMRRARGCYICKKRYYELHAFYDRLCPECASFNWKKRIATTDLTGKVILLTGARVKIGFECGRRLLECGATLIATTRFPNDCARRYAELDRWEEFKNRLHIFGVDLRDLQGTVQLCQLLLERFDRIDAIINNAAQTIRRPPAYFRHVLPGELHPDQNGISSEMLERVQGCANNVLPLICNTPGTTQLLNSTANTDSGEVSSSDVPIVTNCDDPKEPRASAALLSQLIIAEGDDDEHNFPLGVIDHLNDRQQLDLRTVNSWTLLLDQVQPVELVEVFAVNALSPFIINSRLKPLLMANKDSPRFIVNVSAMEGQFYRHKSADHPHTNMAKAALNMMTRTSAEQYARDGIFMTSVDTGWINDENPIAKSVRKMATDGWHPPLDEMDAMARVLDPIIDGFENNVKVYGKFLKDFHETEW